MSPPTSATLATGAANILLFGALLIPPSVLSHRWLAATFVPLIWSCNFHAWQGGLGFLSCIQALWVADLLLCRNPREDFKVINYKASKPPATKSEEITNNKVWKEPYPKSFWPRIWWVSKLVVSPRFVGWDTGDNDHSVENTIHGSGKEQPRGRWLLRRFLSAAWCFLVIDATTSYKQFDSYFLTQLDIDSPLPYFLTNLLGKYCLCWFIPRMIRIVVFGLQLYSIFSIFSSIPALLCVSLEGLGVMGDFWGNPLNWPHLMGNPLTIFHDGLRGFWAKVWQQFLRRMLGDPGKAISRALNIPTKSIASYVLQVVVAFFLSGALHALTLPRDNPDSSPLRYGGFLWIQGVCVVVEAMAEHVLGNTKRVRPLWMRRGIGLVRTVWVVGVMYSTVPLILGELEKISSGTESGPVFLFPTPQK